MPAECCGVVGLRPSLARYPQSGVVPCNIRHDRAGPMADTVANLAVVDAVLAGEECSAASIQPADLSAGARFAVDMDMYAEASDGLKVSKLLNGQHPMYAPKAKFNSSAEEEAEF